MEERSIKDVLEELGYQLTPDKNGAFRAKPLYRPSNNPTSLKINGDGSFIDFSAGLRGKSLEELVKLTLGLQSVEEAAQWIKNKNLHLEDTKNIIPKLKMAKVFPKEMLENLLPEHDYWTRRGIDLDTIKLFRGGLCRVKSRFQDYYVFTVWDSSKNLVGFAGRDVTEQKKVKWRLVGNKGEWRYPLFLNYSIINKKKEVILLESIGDGLSCWCAGIQNFMVLFGIEMSLSVLNFLLKLNPKKIIISLNNDKNNNNAGNEAAEKMLRRLNRYFNLNQLEIKLPKEHKDWNNVLLKSGTNLIKEQLL